MILKFNQDYSLKIYAIMLAMFINFHVLYKTYLLITNLYSINLKSIKMVPPYNWIKLISNLTFLI